MQHASRLRDWTSAIALFAATTLWPSAALPQELAADSQGGVRELAATEQRTLTAFRRILVPFDRIDEIILQNERFLPVPRDEFLRLARAVLSPNEASMHISHARFRARLEGNRLVQGTGQLEVAYQGQGAQWLEIKTSGIVKGRPGWTDQRSLLAGTYLRGDGSYPSYGLIADAAGTVRFTWTAAGRSQGTGAVFSLCLPTAAITELVIETSSAVRLATDSAALISTDPNAAGRLEHRLLVRGGTPFVLTATRIREDSTDAAFAISQTTEYVVEPGSTQVKAQLEVTRLVDGPRQLTLNCPRKLQINQVRLGGNPLPFREHLSAESDRDKHITLELPPALISSKLTIGISAVSDTPLGESSPLPALRPQRVLWIEGAIDLAISDDLQVFNLNHEGFQPARTALPADVDRTRWAFKQVVPEAVVRLGVRRAPKRLSAQALTVAEIKHQEVAATTTIEFSCEYGVESILEAELDGDWRVHTVETQPAGQLRSWSVERNKTGRSLMVVLDQPVTPQKSVTIVCRSTLNRPGRQNLLRASDLAVLRFSQPGVYRRWIQAVPASALGLFLEVADSVPPVLRSEIPSSLQPLLADHKDARLISADSLSEQVYFQTRPLAAEVAVDVQSTAAVTSSVVRYAYRFLLDPRSGDVQRFSVQFSDRIDGKPQWRIVDSLGRDLTAEQVPPTSEETTTANPRSVLQWRLGQPRRDSFEVLVSFDQPFRSASPLILGGVETAIHQTGTVRVTADRALQLALDNQGLEPIPSLSVETEDPPYRLLGLFRYQPDRLLIATANPPLTIHELKAADMAPGVWIRSATLDSAYLPGGQILHSLSMSVDARGNQRLEIELPLSDEVLYRVGSDRWMQAPRTADDRIVSLPLPAQETLSHVEMQFAEMQQPLGTLSSLERSPLRFTSPLGPAAYRAWVPGGYRVIQIENPAQRLLSVFYALGTSSSGIPSHSFPDASTLPAGFADGVFAWSSHELDPVAIGNDRGNLPVFHAATLRLLCVSLFAAGGLVGVCFYRIDPRLALFAVVLCCVGVLVVPPGFVPPVSASAWGFGAALTVQMLFKRCVTVLTRLSTNYEQGSQASLVAIVLLTCLPTQSVLGQLSSLDESSVSVPAIIDPIDQDRRPVGPYIYLPESLYGSFLRHERFLRTPINEWLISGAEVHGSLVDASGENAEATSPWRLVLEIETFRDAAVVRLPVERSTNSTEAGGPRLDGGYVEHWWTTLDGDLRVRIPKSGRHHVELNLRPSVQIEAEQVELTLPLVHVEPCWLELTVSTDLPPLGFSNIAGSAEFSATTSSYRGNIGATDKLVVHWQAPSGTGTTATEMDVLTWLRLRPTATLIEQHLLVSGKQDRGLRFEVLPPAGFRFMPVDHGLEDVVIESGQGTPNAITIAINRRQAADVIAVPLAFIADRGEAPNNILVPRSTIPEGRVGKRYLAIEVPDDIQFTPQLGMADRAIPVEEFVRLWGPVDEAPDAAYQEAVEAVPWRIAIENRKARIKAAESTIAVASRSGIEAHYRAECQIEQGAIVLLEMHTTEGFRVLEVEVMQGDQVVALTWDQASDKALNVVLAQPISGAFSILVRGRLDADAAGRVGMPLLSLQAEETSVRRLALAREPGIVFEVEQTELLVPAPDPSLPPDWEDKWYLQGQYTVSVATSSDAEIWASIGPTGAPSAIDMVVFVDGALQGWDANLHCSIQAPRQPVDRFVLVAPMAWQGPLQVEPAGRWRVTVHEERQQQRIILRPLRPLGADIQFTLRGQMKRENQDLVTVPAIRLVEPVAHEAVVALPQQMLGQASTWQTQGLRRIEPSPRLNQVFGDASRWSFFRVGQSIEPATARLVTVEPTTSVPYVTFLDVEAFLDEEGNVYAESTFSLDPRGRRSCRVVIPEDYELLRIRVGDRNVASWNTAAQHWHVQLESSQLPQLITIAYRRISARQENNMHVDAPGLFAETLLIPVQQTAWHIHSNVPWRHRQSDSNSLDPISQHMLSAVRLANLVESLDEMVPALSGTSAASSMLWLSNWRRNIAAAVSRYEAESASGASDANASQAVESALDRLAEIDRLFADSLATTSAGADATPGDTSSNNHILRSSSNGFSLRLLGDGQISRLQLVMNADSAHYGVQRVLGIALLSLIGIGTVLFGKRTAAANQSGIFETRFPAVLLLLAALVVLLSGELWGVIAVFVTAVTVTGLHLRRLGRHRAAERR